MQNKFQFTSSFHQNRDWQNRQTVGRSLRNLLKATLNFMVLRPQPSAQPVSAAALTASKDCYASKAGSYAYRQSSEEQRDWLERLYHMQ